MAAYQIDCLTIDIVHFYFRNIKNKTPKTAHRGNYANLELQRSEWISQLHLRPS